MATERTGYKVIDELLETIAPRVEGKQWPVVEATPRPWHRNVSPAWKYPIYADRDGDPNGRNWIHIAAVLAGNPNAEADLDLIIHAVNSFDRRDIALRQAQTIIQDHVNGIERTAWQEVLDRINEALKDKSDNG